MAQVEEEDLEKGNQAIHTIDTGLRSSPRVFFSHDENISAPDAVHSNSEEVRTNDTLPSSVLPQQASNFDNQTARQQEAAQLRSVPTTEEEYPSERVSWETMSEAADATERSYSPVSYESGTIRMTEEDHVGETAAGWRRNRSDWDREDLRFALRSHRYALITHIVSKPRKTAVEKLVKLFTAREKRCELSRENGGPDSANGLADTDPYIRRYADEGFRVNFAEMQRMRLRKLQCRLIDHAVTIRCDAHEPKNWEDELKQYIEAVKDYDYMLTYNGAPKDPFVATSERLIDDYIIDSVLGGNKPTDRITQCEAREPWQQESQPIVATRDRHIAQMWVKGFKERVLMAALGGFFLIGPMWLMVKRNDQSTSLVATTMFVVGFGLLMAWSLDNAKEVMSNTAAYAAVLVVFVGLGGTSG